MASPLALKFRLPKPSESAKRPGSLRRGVTRFGGRFAIFSPWRIFPGSSPGQGPALVGSPVAVLPGPGLGTVKRRGFPRI